jgi:hypothetical protein
MEDKTNRNGREKESKPIGLSGGVEDRQIVVDSKKQLFDLLCRGR